MGRLAAVPPAPTFITRGFTLTELALVLLIVGLLLGGMLMPLSMQEDIRRGADTQKTLNEARDALIGFALTNDRLPCPASATSNGLESFCSNDDYPCSGTVSTTKPAHGRCSNPFDGFLPAAALGITPIDAQGYAIDGFAASTANRIRYAVSTATYAGTTTVSNYVTRDSGMKSVANAGGLTKIEPDIKVCNGGSAVQNPGNATTAACSSGNALILDAFAVIYSLGKNAATGGTGDAEKHNPNPNTTTPAGDPAFVSMNGNPTFDDILVWLPRSILINRLVAAGRLP